MQSLRDLLSTNPKATWGEIARYDIGTANALAKHNAEIDKEQRLAQKARLDAAEQAGKVTIQQKEAALNELAGIAQMTDPEVQGPAFMKWQSQVQPLGMGQGVPWPLNQKGVEYAGLVALGPKGWQEYLDKRTKAQWEAEDRIHEQMVNRPLAEQKAYFDAVTARNTATGQTPMSDYQRQQLAQSKQTHEDTVANQQRLYDLAVKRLTESNALSRERLNKATSLGSAAAQKNMLALKNLDDAISGYENELKVTGPTMQQDKGAKLRTWFTNLQMQTKELYQLGALAGPDMDLINKALIDPTGWSANWRPNMTQTLLDQLDVIKSVVKRAKNNAATTYQQQKQQAESDAGTSMEEKSNDDLFRILTGGK